MYQPIIRLLAAILLTAALLPRVVAAQPVTDPAECSRILDSVAGRYFDTERRVGSGLGATLRVTEIDIDSSRSSPELNAVADKVVASLRMQSFRLTMAPSPNAEIMTAPSGNAKVRRNPLYFTDSGMVDGITWNLAYYLRFPLRDGFNTWLGLGRMASAKGRKIDVLRDAEGYAIIIHHGMDYLGVRASFDLKLVRCAVRVTHPEGWSQVVYYYDPAAPDPYLPVSMEISYGGDDPVFHLNAFTPLRRVVVSVSDYHPENK